MSPMFRAWLCRAGGVASPLLALLLTSAAPLGQGCGTSCGMGSGPAVQYKGGQLDASGTFYQTAKPGDRLLFFPADRRIDIHHGLGSRDLAVSIYLSFDEKGSGQDDSSPAPSSGNQAEIETIDENVVRVHNHTCSQFYVRVTAQRPPKSS